LLVLLSFLLPSLLLVGVAQAHGELESGTPKEGAVLKKVPKHAYLNFSEAPSPDSVMKVFDGCNQNVVKKLERFDITLHAELRAGQPGTWKLVYDVISDEDGHETSGSYNFKVKGAKDCSADTEDPDDTAAPGTQAAGDLTDDEGGGGFPVVPVAIGAIVLIAGAALIRAKTSN
jgi:methionine-rich copper-binding protein CopC